MRTALTTTTIINMTTAATTIPAIIAIVVQGAESTTSTAKTNPAIRLMSISCAEKKKENGLRCCAAFPSPQTICYPIIPQRRTGLGSLSCVWEDGPSVNVQTILVDSSGGRGVVPYPTTSRSSIPVHHGIQGRIQHFS